MKQYTYVRCIFRVDVIDEDKLERDCDANNAHRFIEGGFFKKQNWLKEGRGTS